MLTVVLLVVPSVFGLLLWNSFRTNRARTRAGIGYAPPSGVERWVDDAEGAGEEDTPDKSTGTNGPRPTDEA